MCYVQDCAIYNNKREQIAVIRTSGDNTTSDLFTKNINKRMCMLYKHMVEKLLWIIEVKRVDHAAGVSIRLKTTNGPQFDPDDCSRQY